MSDRKGNGERGKEKLLDPLAPSKERRGEGERQRDKRRERKIKSSCISLAILAVGYRAFEVDQREDIGLVAFRLQGTDLIVGRTRRHISGYVELGIAKYPGEESAGKCTHGRHTGAYDADMALKRAPVS
jgi:hypothetical protein